ncbi:Hypothetical predicted protein [Octopus vulgaris]|uniref:Uncharacterized protein n=1 Tax=Octopus vulgaris TaxID=6645 RepID=A0AA36BMB7_OCTVU|nr:Hypothetical predicted protein [Octopus vulgaris]
MLLPTAPTSSFSPHTKPLSVPHRLNDKQISKRSNVPISSDCSDRQNNHNNKLHRVNIASFHDWSEKSLENAPVSKIYQEMATLSSICSLSESNQNGLSRENNGRRQVGCHKLFLPEGTDLTKGEKNIIAGLCRNRGCVLPHIDVSKKESNSSSENCKRVNMKGKKIVSYFPSIQNLDSSSMFLQTVKTNKKEECIYHWWEQNPNVAANCLRKYNASCALPLGMNYFKDYMSCLFLDMGSQMFHAGRKNSSSSSPYASSGSSRNLHGIKAPPNTPNLEVTNAKDGKVKNGKSNRKEVKLENSKKKTHLVVYVPKAEEDICDKDSRD